MERISEVLRIARAMKGPEIEGFLQMLRRLPSSSWEFLLSVWRVILGIPEGIVGVIPQLPSLLWWWVVPGLVSVGALIGMLWICTKRIHWVFEVLAGIGALLVVWGHWNILAASMIVWGYPFWSSALEESAWHMFMSFVVLGGCAFVVWGTWNDFRK